MYNRRSVCVCMFVRTKTLRIGPKDLCGASLHANYKNKHNEMHEKYENRGIWYVVKDILVYNSIFLITLACKL